MARKMISGGSEDEQVALREALVKISSKCHHQGMNTSEAALIFADMIQNNDDLSDDDLIQSMVDARCILINRRSLEASISGLYQDLTDLQERCPHHHHHVETSELVYGNPENVMHQCQACGKSWITGRNEV